MREQTHYDKYPQAPVSIAEIKAIYDNAGMNLRQGVKIGNLEKNPIAVSPDGDEQLSYVMLTGDTAIGVSVTSPFYGDGYRRMEKIRLSVLPIGNASERIVKKGSSATLAELDFRKLRSNLRFSAEMSVGREKVSEHTGNPDMLLSREHVQMKILSTGQIFIADTSLNGTTVISAEDVAFTQGLSVSDREKIATFLNPLADNPDKWIASSAGHHIINPYQ